MTFQRKGQGTQGPQKVYDHLAQAMNTPLDELDPPLPANQLRGSTRNDIRRRLLFFLVVILLVLLASIGLYIGIGIAVHAIAGSDDTPSQQSQSYTNPQPVSYPPISTSYPTIPTQPSVTPTPLPPTPVPTPPPPDDGQIVQMITAYFNNAHFHNEGTYVGDDVAMDVSIDQESGSGTQLSVTACISYKFSEGTSGFGIDNSQFLFLFAYSNGAWGIIEMEVATSGIINC